MYSTQQLATLSGVSARTLRYYDQIGLLTPPLAANGYRQYGPAEVDRLQLILTYRALGFALADIRTLLDQPPAQRVQALAQQREKLLANRRLVDQQLAQLEVTLTNQKGASNMPDTEKFAAFKQAQIKANDEAYGNEVTAKYGNAAKAAADARFAGLSEAQYNAMTVAETQLKTALLAYLTAPALPGADAAAAYHAHREWLLATTPQLTPVMHRGLAAMYVADPRFTAYYTKLTGSKQAAAALQAIVDYYAIEE